MHGFKLLLAPALLLAAGLANATNLYDPSVSSTSDLDGSSVVLDGTLSDTNGNAEPWVVQVFAGVGECLRLFVPSAEFAPKLVVVSPDGHVYRDSTSGGSRQPLVRIASAPARGWYTVQVAQVNGVPQNANFELLYGRYTAGNVNCAVTTRALEGARGDGIDQERALPPAAKNPDAP